MKDLRPYPYLKYLRFIILLVLVLFNFSPVNIGVAHALVCYTLTLTSNPSAGGTISADPAPNCGGTQYTEGTVVTVTGLPEAGYLFGAWQGAITGTLNPNNVVMSANKSVTAIFIADQWQKAIDISVPSSRTVDTTLANIEPVNEPSLLNCNGVNIRGGKATIWYKYTAAADGLVSLDTLGSFQTAINPQTGIADQYDTYIAVWTGTIDTDPSDGNPTLVACNDDNDATAAVSQLGFPAVAGTTYYIQVAQYRGPAGSTSDPYYNGGTLSFHAGFGSQTEVYIGGGAPKDTYTILSGNSTRDSYVGVNSGPVRVLSANTVPIMAAERVIYTVNNVITSFSEMMGLPASQLSTTYWLPWYNNVDLDTQLRFGNVSGSAATVHVFIGGVEMVGSPFTLATSGAGQSTRLSFAGINNGPVKIVSDVPIVAAERVIYKINGINTSFSEMMALPNSQLSTTYHLPWYNNVDLDTQLRFGNVSGSTATVHVFIGGTEMVGSPFILTASGAGQSTRMSFAGINSGPVKIVSDVPIVAAERVIYKINNVPTSFSEMMALPDSLLDTTYHLPWYNNVDLDTQLRFGNVSGLSATVHVYVGGIEMVGSPFNLTASGAGQSTRLSFAGVNDGPVKVVSDVPIVVAERVIYKINGVPTSFTEMMGLPNSLLNASYWLPWYNNVDLDTQLRFGVP